MKVGDYVRTEYGIFGKIAKIIGKEKGLKDCYLNFKNMAVYGNETDYIVVGNRGKIIKLSPDIIELLEPMDLLYIDIDGDFEGGIVVPRMPETLNELNGFVEFIKSGHWILKGVVTHEQLENNMYKVGDDND